MTSGDLLHGNRMPEVDYRKKNNAEAFIQQVDR